MRRCRRYIAVILFFCIGTISRGQTISPESIKLLITQKFQEINFKLFHAVNEGKVQAYCKAHPDSILDLKSFRERCSGSNALRFSSHRHQEISDSFIPETFYNTGMYQVDYNYKYTYYSPYFLQPHPQSLITEGTRTGYLDYTYPQFMISKKDLSSALDSDDLEFLNLAFKQLTGLEPGSNSIGKFVGYCDIGSAEGIFNQLLIALIKAKDSLSWYQSPGLKYTDSLPVLIMNYDHGPTYSCLILPVTNWSIEFPLYLSFIKQMAWIKSDSSSYLQLNFVKHDVKGSDVPEIFIDFQELKEILNNTENAMLLFILDEFSNDF